MLIQAKNVSKSFGGFDLFTDLNLNIKLNRKIGFIGKNGAGKTTFINIIAGDDSEYEGEIIKSPQCKIAYLSQGVTLPEGHTLFDECLSHFSELINKKQIIADLEKEIADKPEDEILQEKYGKLLHDFEEAGGYTIENQVEKVLTGLGFSKEEWNRDISTFSGGEQRRGLLAKVLLSGANLLILDEPTNHLDIVSIKWLEGFLKEYSGTIILVSHDRHFLNNIVSDIVELERGNLHEYPGNYDFYLAEKQRRYEDQMKQFEQQKEKIEKEEEFIRRNIAGQKTKQAQGRRKALEKIDRIEKPTKGSDFKIRIPQSDSTQRKILTVKKLSFGYTEDKKLFENLSLLMEKGDKLGIIGRNGCGKSSLISALIDHKNYIDKIEFNDNIKTIYFSQGAKNLNVDETVFDTISGVNLLLADQDVRDHLAWFQFTGEGINKKVSSLSGGEKTRLALLKDLLYPSDFLILDEPTNHLDIQTREALGIALKEYNGTVLTVSHDRGFLDEFCNRIFLIANNQAYDYLGNYSENENKILQDIKEASIGVINESKEVEKKDKSKKKNVNVFKVEKIEAEIAELEEKIEEVSKLLHNEEVYSNYEDYQKYEALLKECESKLENKMSEWEELH